MFDNQKIDIIKNKRLNLSHSSGKRAWRHYIKNLKTDLTFAIDSLDHVTLDRLIEQATVQVFDNCNKRRMGWTKDQGDIEA